MNKICLAHSLISKRADGIIEIETNSNHEFSLSDVKETTEAVGELTGGKKAPLLIMAGSLSAVSNEARKFMATEESLKYSIAEAFVINTITQRILLNFYLKFDKPPIPLRDLQTKLRR
jgi:hypothetical protein